MHLARWLTAWTLLAFIAAPLPGCRKPIPKPFDSPDGRADSGGSGGRGGGGGVGGSGGGTNGPSPDADPNDARITDRPDVVGPDGPEPCGQPGTKCCPGNRCEGGGCCDHQGICVQHGTKCPDETLSCISASCGGECGAIRDKCCSLPGADAGFCTYPLTVCVRNDAGASCQGCGNTGEPCCRDNYCEPPNRRCVAGRCQSM